MSGKMVLRRVPALLVAATAIFATAVSWPISEVRSQEPTTQGDAPTIRRISEAQYTGAIAAIFGLGINVPRGFEPPLRNEGLLAIGESRVAVTPTGMEQYEVRAREIAAQVMAGPRRDAILTCRPSPAGTFDEPCARQFLSKYGRLLLRRPLDRDELASVMAIARSATTSSGNFHSGLETALSRLLVSPFFIFRVEAGDKSGQLDSYSLATRLSFLLWNGTPDEALLDAAARGDLKTEVGLARQVDRLIASPHFEQGVRAYFWDMFGYNQFDGLTKEQTIYKKYVSQLAKDAEEQSLRTIVDHLVHKNGDYRDLFTTRETFLNRRLAAVYRVPIAPAGFDGWTRYKFQPGDQRQGLLSLIGFLMLDPSHEGRSSPTNRGKFVREALMCQSVPPPPANVNFALVSDTENALYKTARQRLTVHQENPVCAGCHKITDPVGLSMENYDAIGQYRTHENDAPIDASGSLGGKAFHNALEMQTVLRDDPALTTCVAQRVFEYGVGHKLNASEEGWLTYAHQRFADQGYRIPALMRVVALSKAFRSVAPAGPALALSNSEKKRGFHGEMVTAQRP